ncbi:MAG TPA: C39 family peptidase [Syntrophales bacterium]|nr:C39 family peptidase [Syntrophales bacterium]
MKKLFGRFAIAILLFFPTAIFPGNHLPSAHGQATAALQESQTAPVLDRVKNFIRVPLIRQMRDYTCGAAALQSVLVYYGEDIGQAELARLLGSDPQKGTSYRAILRFANRKFPDPRKRDFWMWKRCGMTIDDLRQEIDRGKPAILAFQAWAKPGVNWKKEWNEGHYAVAIGYDENNLIFMDPSVLGHYAFIPVDEFLDRWHDRDPSTGERLIQCGLVIGNDWKTPSYDYRVIQRID